MVLGLTVPLTEMNKLKVTNHITGLDRHLSFQEVEAPRLKDNQHMKVARLSTLLIDHHNYEDVFLVLISVRG
jgi:hypothetical protein